MTYNKGFINWIVLIVIILLIVSYFGFDVRGIIEDEQTQENFSYVWSKVTQLWNDYLKQPALWIWDNIILFIWDELLLENLEGLRSEGGIDDTQPESPQVEE